MKFHLVTQQTRGQMFSGFIRTNLNFLALHLVDTQHCWSPSPLWSMAVLASCCWHAIHYQRLGNCSGFMRKTCTSLQETWDGGGALPSSRTMTLRIQPELHWSGLTPRTWCVQTVQSKPRSQSDWESVAKLLFVNDGLCSVLQILSSVAKKNGQKTSGSRCSKHIET